jgi:hypothetical protein
MSWFKSINGPKIISWPAVTKWLKNHWLITIIIAIWLILGAVACFWYLYKFGVLNWSVLSGVATWILALGVFIAIIQIQQSRNAANEQAEETRKNINAQIAIDLFDRLRSKEMKETLRFIYSLNKDDLPPIYVKDLYRIEDLIDIFDLLGNLVVQEIVEKKLAIEAYAGPPALRCWYQLSRFLRELEKERGTYVINYEDFVRLTYDYFVKEKMPLNLKNFRGEIIPVIDEIGNWIRNGDERRPRRLSEIKSDRNKTFTK